MNKTKTAEDNDGVTVEAPELNSIFNFDKEEQCWKGQYIDNENKIPYQRWKSVEQTTWENFKAKCVDPRIGRWFTSGDGTGLCKGK